MQHPPSDLASFLERGPSLVVGTRRADFSPELTRAAGARLGADGLLRVALPMPEAHAAFVNLAQNGVIALSVVQPTTYVTLQIKGCDARAIEWPQMHEVARQHLREFERELELVGIKDFAARAWSHHSFQAIAFTPEEMFDQTPGPHAGRPVSR